MFEIVLKMTGLLALAGIAAAADPKEKVRDLYAEINAAEFDVETIGYRDEQSPRTGEISLSKTDRGALRKARVESVLGDHGWRSAEIYFDSAGAVRFVFAREGSWRFDATSAGESGTLDSVNELRFYFDEDGSLISGLNKSYEFRDNRNERAAADAAPNREIEVATMAAGRIRQAAAGFRAVDSPASARAAEEVLANVIELRGESDPPPAPEAWIVLDWPEGSTFAGTFGATGVAFEMLRTAGVVADGPDAPGVVCSTVLDPEAEPPKSVLITLDRLADDSVRGERYRIDLAIDEDGIWRPVFFGKQIRCHEGRGHRDWSREFCR